MKMILASRATTLNARGGAVAMATAGFLSLLLSHFSEAVLGVGAMLSATEGAAPADLGFVTLIERMFGLWSYLATWLLWRGHIQSPAGSTPC